LSPNHTQSAAIARSDAELLDAITDPDADLSAFLDPDYAAAMLVQSARILRQRGWIQGQIAAPRDGRNEPAAVCAAGALNLAAGADDPGYYIDVTVLAVFARYLDPRSDVEPVELIEAWNDEPDRTGEQVRRALLDAARHARRLITPGGRR
jgi:hypothetical protein